MHGMEALRPLLAERSPQDQERVEAAYVFARDAHEGVNRKSGEPYITHPVAVAYILAELGMDTDSLVAGLLHDTVEDTHVTMDDVERHFGPDVRRIVEGETKVSKLAKVAKSQDPDRTLSDEQSENMRRLLIAMTGDIRVIIVKLADRLHNMRTLGSMAPVKQARIARETMEIFAPLAHRLGIGQVKWELEDLSFKYLEPEAYIELQERLRTRQDERDAHIQQALTQMQEALDEDIELFEWVDEMDVSGRSKHLWSIYTKMEKEGKALEQIFDLLAIRVILTPKAIVAPDSSKRERAEQVREKRVCYHSLSIVHSMWTPIPGRFKDYIAVPKPNGYQSLHTTVISPSGQPVEVQIRSRRMHEVAEYGVAAHWMYKQGDKLGGKQRETWLTRLQQLQHEITDASDFVDAVKEDLLGGRVVVFTPRGDTRDLPSGSTPIDFAYNVHSRIGDTATGARVNGSIVPLSYQLQNGEMVEIITGKQGTPSKDWLNFAVTRSARTKIRHHFRAQERAGALQHGHDLLERYLRKRQLPVRQLMRTRLLEDVAEKMTGTRNPDDLYLALHAGKLTTGAVARVLAPQLEQERVRPPQATPLPRALLPRAPLPRLPLPRGENSERVYVEGVLTQAKRGLCCSPIQGDSIMAYVTRGRGYTIHRIDCPNMVRLLKDEPEDRCRPASWNPSEPGLSAVDLDVVAADRPGLLADVLAALVAQKRSPLKVEAEVRGRSAHVWLRLEVGGQSDLSVLADAIRGVEGVRDVLRVGNKSGRVIPSGGAAATRRLR